MVQGEGECIDQEKINKPVNRHLENKDIGRTKKGIEA